MASENLPITSIESYQPALDYRKTGQVGIIDGKNFAWDVSGFFSAYASRLVSKSISIGAKPSIAQTLELQDTCQVVVGSKIWRLLASSELSPVGVWSNTVTLAQLSAPSEDRIGYNRLKWTAAYLGGESYIANYNYGVFRVTLPGTYTRLTQGTVPGFPDDTDPVIAICESNGRLCYMTKTIFFWSAPADPDNLVPTIGGAGFQVIAERVGGTPFAMIPVAGGVIIFTTAGTLACEFIGGNFVFRYWTIDSEVLPVSSFSITKLDTESYIIMTRLGLYVCQNLAAPQKITPVFNEFMREYLRNHEAEKCHIWYSIVDNRLYIGFRGLAQNFIETMALDLGIDKWGLFNRPHIGMVQYGISQNQFAYVDTAGRASYLLSSSDRRKDTENPATPGQMLGLDSWVTLGWIRAQSLQSHPDVTQEMNQLVVNRSGPMDDADTQYVDEGLLADMAGADSEDEGLLSDVSDSTTIFIDEGLLENRTTSTSYSIEWLSDMFEGRAEYSDYVTVNPELVEYNRYYDIWVAQQSAQYHRVKFKAANVGEYFRANTLGINVTYSGRQG